MKLPFTIKNKRRNTNFKFEFQNYFIFILKKTRFWFLKKNTQKKFVHTFSKILTKRTFVSLLSQNLKLKKNY